MTKRTISMAVFDVPFPIRLLFGFSMGIWICACDLSETRGPDTLTFHLDDSLKTSYGKYDSLHLDLYTLQGPDTVFAGTVFHGQYLDSDQLRDLPLGVRINGDFSVRVVAYRNGEPILEVGVPFTKEGHAGEPIIYRAPADVSPNAHSPHFISGIQDFSLGMGESRRIVVKARDEDGDPIHFQIQNLDSLRALFQGNAIRVAMDGDSLTLDFSPGPIGGDFRFRIALLDPPFAPVIQTLTVSVGVVSRPPSVVVQGPGPGTGFLLKEGETLSLNVSAYDPDPEDSVFLLSLANPPWPGCGQGGFDTVTGILSFSPSFQCVAAGDTTFSAWIFKAVGKGASPETGQVAIQITVRDSNSAPKWKSSTILVSGKEGEPMSLDLSDAYLGDAECDSVGFSAQCGSMDAKTLRWDFTPGFRDAGTLECGILAKDDHLPPATGIMVLNLTIADSLRPVDVAIVSPVRGLSTRDSLVIVKWKVGDQWQVQDTLEILHKEGANSIRRSFKDSSGSVGSDSVLVYRDTQAPLSPVGDSNLRAPTNNPRPSWVWKSGGRGGSGYYRYKLEDTLWASDGFQGEVNTFTPKFGLSEGKHTLCVEERDSVGNWSNPGCFTVETDYTPPNVPIMSSTGFHTLNPKPTWQWESGGKGGVGTYRMKLDDSNLGVGSTIVMAKSYTPLIGFASGTRHILYLQERDEVGNWSEPASFGVRIHSQAGFVVGGNGSIMRTTNAGGDWDTVSRPSESYLKSAWFLDANTGFIAGDNGRIYRTLGGGSLWFPMNSGTSATISSMLFISDRLGYAATESGEIRRTTDAGESWELVSKPAAGGLSSISFTDSLHGLAVSGSALGARGSMLSTADGGRTWSKPINDAPYALIAVTHVGANRAFAVGNYGAILASTDSGATWREIPSGTKNYLTSVFFVSESTGFIAGDQGTVLKTTDGGEHWAALATGTEAWLSSVYFTDERTGYASGSESTILRTTDGGATWSKLAHLITYHEPVSGNISLTSYPMFSTIYFP